MKIGRCGKASRVLGLMESTISTSRTRPNLS